MEKRKGTIRRLFILLSCFAALSISAVLLGSHYPIRGRTPAEADKGADAKEKIVMPSSTLYGSSRNSLQAEIVIDPGHGGADPGVARKNLVESEINLDISKRVKAFLEQKSHLVALTRSSSGSLYWQSSIDGTLQERELDARVNMIDSTGARLFVSIHVNSYPEYPGMTGSIVYFNPKDPQSYALSQCIQKHLNTLKTKGLKRDAHFPEAADFYLLVNSSVPGVLVETAFITNKTERNLLSTESFRAQIAGAIAEGIDEYSGQQ